MPENKPQAVGLTEDGRVNVRLAHPLTEADRVRFGLSEDAPIGVGDVVTVSKTSARAIAGAGLAQGVDPAVPSQVAGLLTAPDGALVVADPSLVDPGVSGGQPGPLGAEAIAALRGADLDKALTDRGLSTSGTVDEKRARLGEHVVETTA